MGADIANVFREIRPDIVYNCLHGTYGEDGCLHGLLNIMRIPYTHSGVLTSSVSFNKVLSRALFVANNFDVANAIVINKQDGIKIDPMPRPYVIKPLDQGSSIGVEVIFEEDDFDFANYDFAYGDQIIVEEYIKGREMQVAVLNGKALGALELKILKNRFYDYETKYTDGFAQHILPAKLPKELYKDLLTKSELAYRIMGCLGIARVEFIYSEEKDRFFILEINTHPGMTPLSICPEIAASCGISFKDLVEEIVKTAKFE